MNESGIVFLRPLQFVRNRSATRRLKKSSSDLAWGASALRSSEFARLLNPSVEKRTVLNRELRKISRCRKADVSKARSTSAHLSSNEGTEAPAEPLWLHPASVRVSCGTPYVSPARR